MDPKATVDQIKAMATDACFYRQADNMMLRMDFTDDTYFQCSNENTGDQHQIEFDEVDLKHDAFFKLVEMTIPE